MRYFANLTYILKPVHKRHTMLSFINKSLKFNRLLHQYFSFSQLKKYTLENSKDNSSANNSHFLVLNNTEKINPDRDI